MKLFLSGVCKKPSLEEPEDLVGENAGFYWLLDGATPPAGGRGHDLTYKYVQTMNQALKMNSKTAETPEELLYNAIEYVKNDFHKNDIDKEYLPCSTAIIVQVLEDCLRYLVLGDSFLCVYTEKDDQVITDDRLKSIAVEERKIVREMRKNGVPEESDKYLTARKKLIFAELESRNKEGGYWVAELDPAAAKQAKRGTISFKRNENILVLAVTDGLERLVSLFEAYPSLKEVGNTIMEKGDSYIFEQLRSLENNPQAFKRSVSSKHDDASYFLLVN